MVSGVCGLMTKTLALLELSLYEGYGALALTHRNLDTLTPYDGRISQTNWSIARNLDFGAPIPQIVATRSPAKAPPVGIIVLVVGSLYKSLGRAR